MDNVFRFALMTAWVAALFALLIVIAVTAVRWARRGSPASSFVGWALQLPTAGMNPQPPPQQQVAEVSQQTCLKKDAESGEPGD